jgi:VWFA-related protein
MQIANHAPGGWQPTKRFRGDSVPAVLVCVAFLCIVTSTPVPAQNTSPDEVRVSSRPYVPPQASIKVQTNLVEVDVVVRNAHGKPVADLKQSDFQIFDDGKLRAITAFAVETHAAPAAGMAPTSRPSAEVPAAAPAPVKPAGPPRFIAFYFDDIHTNSGDLQHAKLAAKRFLREALTLNDRVAIFTSSSTNSLDFTNDVSKLLGAIEKLQARPRISESGLAPCPRITPYQAYLIVNNDPAALQAALAEKAACENNGQLLPGAPIRRTNEGMVTVQAQAEQTWDQAKMISENTLAAIQGVVNYLSKAPGNRMLLLVSSGFLSGTLESEEDTIIREALHAGVVIDALDAKGLYAEGPGRPINEIQQMAILPIQTFVFEESSRGSRLQAADDAMANFAQSTGGLFFHNNNDLDFGFRELGMVPEVTYLLGFDPAGVASDGKYHKLKVKLTAANQPFVQARPGYFVLAKEEATRPVPENEFDREVFAADKLSDVPVAVITQPGMNDQGKPILWVDVHVDVRRLSFEFRDNRSMQNLRFVMALLDSKGDLVAGKEGVMRLALKQPTLDHFEQAGLSAKVFLEAPPGSYELRTVTQESSDGKISCSTIPVQVQ